MASTPSSVPRRPSRGRRGTVTDPDRGLFIWNLGRDVRTQYPGKWFVVLLALYAEETAEPLLPARTPGRKQIEAMLMHYAAQHYLPQVPDEVIERAGADPTVRDRALKAGTPQDVRSRLRDLVREVSQARAVSERRRGTL